jgi:uncharacterized membrane protein
MQSRPAWTWIVLAVGVLLALISIFADQIGLGTTPGFGWKQTLGLVVGVVLAVLGVWRMR